MKVADLLIKIIAGMPVIIERVEASGYSEELLRVPYLMLNGKYMVPEVLMEMEVSLISHHEEDGTMYLLITVK